MVKGITLHAKFSFVSLYFVREHRRENDIDIQVYQCRTEYELESPTIPKPISRSKLHLTENRKTKKRQTNLQNPT